MKKKIFFLLLTLAVCLFAALSLSATVHNGLCDCGREFSSRDTADYMIYDCLGCGRNYLSCVCRTCWCGAELTRTETESGITVTTCNDCSLPCEECICRDRSYYESLKGVSQGMSGVEVPNPEGALAVLPAVLLPFVLFVAAYFTVYRRGSSTRARKDRTPRLEKALDRIDREPDPLKRYLLAKNLEESKRDGDLPVSDREGRVLCHRKNELLAEAVEEEWIRDAVRENLRHCRMMNDAGLMGSVETADRVWDSGAGDLSAERSRTPARCLVKWDTGEPLLALFEAVTPLNDERESNLILVASNTTRFVSGLGEKESLMNRKTDPDSRDEIYETLQRLVPEGDVDLLMALPGKSGDVCKLPRIPDEVNPRRAMGEKVRFRRGGMTE